MKKLKKIGKIAIPAVGVVAAGAGAVKTYGDYNKTDNTLMLENVEAMTAIYEPCTKAKAPDGTIKKVKYFYGECVSSPEGIDFHASFGGSFSDFDKLESCPGATHDNFISALPYAYDSSNYWSVPSGVAGACGKKVLYNTCSAYVRFGICYVKVYD